MTANPMTTKQQIIQLLKKRGAMSANEIAKHLQITDIAIRRHISNLEKDRLIQPELIRQAMGRPTNVYMLTQEAEQLFPKNYTDITLDFLNDIHELSGGEMVDQLFDRREERLKDKYTEQMKGETFDRLVEQLANIQDEKGYMVDLRKDEDTGTYILTEFNCPIHDIAHNYNKACSSELSLFRKVLNADVEQLECKAKGGSRCVYAIKPKKN